jgi:hypothetical protein
VLRFAEAEICLGMRLAYPITRFAARFWPVKALYFSAAFRQSELKH